MQSFSLQPYSWSQLNLTGPKPPPGCCHSLVNYKDKYLILFGGGSFDHLLNDVYVFDLEMEKWLLIETNNSEAVKPRISHSAVIYENKMIVYGGQDLHNPIIYGDLVELDLETWTWSNLGDVPSEPYGPGERRLHSAHVYENKMFVVMGDPQWETAVWYLDLTDHTWHSVGTQGLPSHLSLAGACAAMDGDYLYLFGGYMVYQSDSSSSVLYSNSLYQLNLKTSVWSQVSTNSLLQPPPRYSSSLVAHQGKLFLFGGDANQSETATYFNDFWLLDMNSPTLQWQPIAHRSFSSSYRCYPSARSGMSYCKSRKALYVMGGEMPYESDVRYSSALFQYPLDLSLNISLRDNVLRMLTGHKPETFNSAVLPLGVRNSIRSMLNDPNVNFSDREKYLGNKYEVSLKYTYNVH